MHACMHASKQTNKQASNHENKKRKTQRTRKCLITRWRHPWIKPKLANQIRVDQRVDQAKGYPISKFWVMRMFTMKTRGWMFFVNAGLIRSRLINMFCSGLSCPIK